jgi:hypothetical protein
MTIFITFIVLLLAPFPLAFPALVIASETNAAVFFALTPFLICSASVDFLLTGIVKRVAFEVITAVNIPTEAF